MKKKNLCLSTWRSDQRLHLPGREPDHIWISKNRVEHNFDDGRQPPLAGICDWCQQLEDQTSPARRFVGIDPVPDYINQFSPK